MKTQTTFAVIALAALLIPFSAAGDDIIIKADAETTAPYVIAGGTVTYVIKITNTSNTAVPAVSVRNTLSSSLSLVAASPQAELSTNRTGHTVLIYDIKPLMAHETFTATVDAKAEETLQPNTVISSTTVTAAGDSQKSILTEVVIINPDKQPAGGSATTDDGVVAGATALPRTGIGLVAWLIPILGGFAIWNKKRV